MEIYCTSSAQQSVDIYISSHQDWGSLYPACFLESPSREALLVWPKCELVAVFKAWVSCSLALIALLSPLGWKYTYIYNIVQLHLLRIQLTRRVCLPVLLSLSLPSLLCSLLYVCTLTLKIFLCPLPKYYQCSLWTGALDLHGVKYSHISEYNTNFVTSWEMRQTTADALLSMVHLLWYSDVTKAQGMALRLTEKSLTWSWLIEPLFP